MHDHYLLTGAEYLLYVTAGLCLPFPAVTIQEIEAATVVKRPGWQENFMRRNMY